MRMKATTCSSLIPPPSSLGTNGGRILSEKFRLPLGFIFADEVRQADARQSEKAVRRKCKARQQLDADRREIIAARRRRLGREPAGRRLERARAKLDRHRAA